MKKVLFPILGLILALGLALPVAPAGAHLEGSPLVRVLVADGGSAATKVDVGYVSVWNDSDKLYVKYETTGGWEMTQTHLAVVDADDGWGDLVNRKNNPKVGHFPWSEPHDPPVTEYTYEIDLDTADFAPCTDLWIAAQAEVVNTADEQTFWVVSDTSTMVTQRRAGNVGAFTPVNAPALLAWEPGPLYPNDGADDSGWEANSLWDQRVDYDFTASGHNADWIWESYRVLDPVNGTVITLQRTFDIDGYPASGSLRITCDNGYEAFVNGTSVATGQVSGDWRTSNLKQAFVTQDNWTTVEQPDISSYLQSGENTLTIDAANEYFNTDDSPNPSPGTQSNNPGGCIFEAEISYYPEETAWGGWYDGDRFTDPGNWATYFEYHVQGELEKYGAGTAEWTGDGDPCSGEYWWKLYVPDGAADMAAVAFDCDIALEDITTLTFWKKVTDYGASGWNPSVILLIDADGDGLEFGIYEAMQWHFTHSGALLDDDAFVECESPTGLSGVDPTCVQLDALAMSAWGADASGFLYGTGGYSAGLAGFQSGGPYGVINPTDKVLMVAIVIGGAGSWMDETAYVDDVVIAGA